MGAQTKMLLLLGFATSIHTASADPCSTCATLPALSSCTAAINAGCCGARGEGCAGGEISRCSSECEKVLVPMAEKCANLLDSSDDLLPVAGALERGLAVCRKANHEGGGRDSSESTCSSCAPCAMCYHHADGRPSTPINPACHECNNSSSCPPGFWCMDGAGGDTGAGHLDDEPEPEPAPPPDSCLPSALPTPPPHGTWPPPKQWEFYANKEAVPLICDAHTQPNPAGYFIKCYSGSFSPSIIMPPMCVPIPREPEPQPEPQDKCAACVTDGTCVRTAPTVLSGPDTQPACTCVTDSHGAALYFGELCESSENDCHHGDPLLNPCRAGATCTDCNRYVLIDDTWRVNVGCLQGFTCTTT